MENLVTEVQPKVSEIQMENKNVLSQTHHLATSSKRHCSCESQTEQLRNDIAELQKRISKLEKRLTENDQGHLEKNYESLNQQAAKIEKHMVQTCSMQESQNATSEAEKGDKSLGPSAEKLVRCSHGLQFSEKEDIERTLSLSQENKNEEKENLIKTNRFKTSNKTLQESTCAHKAKKCTCKSSKDNVMLSNLRLIGTNLNDDKKLTLDNAYSSKKNKNAMENRVKNVTCSTTESSKDMGIADKDESNDMQATNTSIQSHEDLFDQRENRSTGCNTSIPDHEIRQKITQNGNEPDGQMEHKPDNSSINVAIKEFEIVDVADAVDITTPDVDVQYHDKQSQETWGPYAMLEETKHSGERTTVHSEVNDTLEINTEQDEYLDIPDPNELNHLVPANSKNMVIGQVETKHGNEEETGGNGSPTPSESSNKIHEKLEEAESIRQTVIDESENASNFKTLFSDTALFNGGKETQQVLLKQDRIQRPSCVADDYTEILRNDAEPFSADTSQVPSQLPEEDTENHELFDKMTSDADIPKMGYDDEKLVEIPTDSDLKENVNQLSYTEKWEKINDESNEIEDIQPGKVRVEEMDCNDTNHISDKTSERNSPSLKDDKEDSRFSDEDSHKVSLRSEDSKSEKPPKTTDDIIQKNLEVTENCFKVNKEVVCSSIDMENDNKSPANTSGGVHDISDECEKKTQNSTSENDVHLNGDNQKFPNAESVEFIERQSEKDMSNTPSNELENMKGENLQLDSNVNQTKDGEGVILETKKDESKNTQESQQRSEQHEKNAKGSAEGPDDVRKAAKQWRALADKEQKDARKSLQDLRDAHSVICIDISGSICDGDAWKRTCTFVTDFVNGLVELSGMKELQTEHVALVTFGHETKVQIRLTDDYPKVLKHLEKLTLGGPSQMFGGLMMTLAAAHSSRYTLGINVVGHPICTKIILVTDGRPTQTYLNAGPDLLQSHKMEETKAMLLQEMETIRKNHHDLFVVPVGEADYEFLDLMVNFADGNLVDFTAGRQLSRRQYLSVNIKTPFDLLTNDVMGGNDEMFSPEDQDDMRNIVEKMQRHRKGWDDKERKPGRRRGGSGETTGCCCHVHGHVEDTSFTLQDNVILQMVPGLKPVAGSGSGLEQKRENERAGYSLLEGELPVLIQGSCGGDSDGFHAIKIASKNGDVQKYFESMSSGYTLCIGTSDGNKPMEQNRSSSGYMLRIGTSDGNKPMEQKDRNKKPARGKSRNKNKNMKNP